VEIDWEREYLVVLHVSVLVKGLLNRNYGRNLGGFIVYVKT
jgi:hypothetical protein